MIVFYHKSDFDGKCSAAIVHKKYPDALLIGVDHIIPIQNLTSIKELEALTFPAGRQIETGEEVFIVDFSFNSEIMNALNNISELFWIDHHTSALKWAHSEGFLATGAQVLNSKASACELVWGHVFSDKKLPWAVWALGAYDSWRWSSGGLIYIDVLPFQYGLRILSKDRTKPDAVLWETLFSHTFGSSFIQDIITNGRVILEYEKQQNTLIANGIAFESELNGYRAIVLNRAYCNSKAFDSVYDPAKHDIMVLFSMSDKGIKYTLFSNKPDIDVSVIAKKYNGGGHKGAAGFMSDSFVIDQYTGD